MSGSRSAALPSLTVRAGPRDGARWVERLKEELAALVQVVRSNKEAGSDWFRLKPVDTAGVRWTGSVWHFYKQRRYEFALEFEIPAAYPETAPDLVLKELEGLTPKMYRGGRICLDVHFKPLWAKNVPRFGIAHALAEGMAPWLAAEIPFLVDAGKISPSETTGAETAAANRDGKSQES